MTNTANRKTVRRFARMPKTTPGTAAATSPNVGTDPAPACAIKRQTKAGLVVALLKQAGGSTMDELTSATGWLPHTVRAALTGLKKKGLPVSSDKLDGVRRYRIPGERA